MRLFSMILVSIFLCASCSLFEEEEETGIEDGLYFPDLGLSECSITCDYFMHVISWAEIDCVGDADGCHPSVDIFCVEDLIDSICEPLCHGHDENINYASSEETLEECVDYIESSSCDDTVYDNPENSAACQEIIDDLHL